MGMLGVCRKVWQTEGVRGFFRGVLPPLMGSSAYRSAQFAVFEAVYTRQKELGWDEVTIPGTGGLAFATVLAGICGSSTRAVIESPIEYAKVKRQTGQSWQFHEVYQGFFMQLPRTVGMMTLIFCGVDSVRRWSHGEALKHPHWQFLTWGGVDRAPCGRPCFRRRISRCLVRWLDLEGISIEDRHIEVPAPAMCPICWCGRLEVLVMPQLTSGG
ncbi:unnamed protein product [Durusdinium trenchii]|uniref:Mitochondrial carrier protein n=1 Tax=Durusdinium trenchii TaxID=1381693 RepID=A0ABP0HRV0_9DINO